MKMRALLVLALAGAVFAQGPFGGGGGPMGPGGRGWRGDPMGQPSFDAVKSYLNLTDDQIQQIRAAQKESRENAQKMFTEIQTSQKSVREQLDSDNPNAAAVGEAMVKVSSLHKQLQKMRTGVNDKALAVLTSEQKTKLASLGQSRDTWRASREAAMLGLVKRPLMGGRGRMGLRGCGRGPMGYKGRGCGCMGMGWGGPGGMGWGQGGSGPMGFGPGGPGPMGGWRGNTRDAGSTSQPEQKP